MNSFKYWINGYIFSNLYETTDEIKLHVYL